MKYKWKIIRKLYLCKCGKCFENRKSFVEHIKDTRRWKKYHYAPDYTEVPFVIFEVKKRNKLRKGK